MSFLFGKKSKGQAGPPQRPADGQNTAGSATSIPTANGARVKERGAGVISPPPGGSVNNSAQSIDDTTPPSPEHVQSQRGRVDSDLSVCLDRIARQVLRYATGLCPTLPNHALHEAEHLLTIYRFSMLHDLPLVVLLPASILLRFTHGPNGDSRSHPHNQTPSLGTAQRSMPRRLKKEICT